MKMIIAALTLGLAAVPGAGLSQGASGHCAVPSQPAEVRIRACLAAVAAKGAKPEAIALDYLDLATAYENWGDRRREIDALGKAIALRPDFWEARVRRAQLYLQSPLFDQALPDYLALRKAFPGPAPIAKGGKIETNGALPGASAQAAFMVPSLQRELLMRSTRRCRARAIVGLELDGAIKDCQISMQIDTGNEAPEREGIGIAKFRQGDWSGALAQFDAVLKTKKDAWSSLYMKGVVERRMGNAAKGDADIAAAKKGDPQLNMTARRAGLMP